MTEVLSPPATTMDSKRATARFSFLPPADGTFTSIDGTSDSTMQRPPTWLSKPGSRAGGTLDPSLIAPSTQHPANIRRPAKASRRISWALGKKQTKAHARHTGGDLTTLMSEAAENGETETIGRILGAGGSYEKKNADGLPPLHVAVIYGQGEAVRCLARMGADVLAKDKEGYAPIHRAALNNRVHLIAHLVNLGAEINQRDSKGRTALHIAAAMPQITEFHSDRASKADPRNSTLRFSYFFSGTEAPPRRPSTTSQSSEYDDCCMIESLIRSGADIELRDKDGNTALHLATREGFLANVRLLLDQGSKLNVRNKQGMTPLGVLMMSPHGDDGISALLLERGAAIMPAEQAKKQKWAWFGMGS
jgi:ankyrin repeat protein